MVQRLDKRKLLLNHYQKFIDNELPKIKPPIIGPPKKKIKSVTVCGTTRRIVFRG